MTAQATLDFMKVDSRKTGGGPPKEHFGDEAEEMVAGLLGNINDPLDMHYDDDALPFQVILNLYTHCFYVFHV